MHAMDWLAGRMEDHISGGYVPGAVWGLGRGNDIRIGAAGHFEIGGMGPEMAPETIFRIASITKPVTAALAMQLVEEGRLALDAPVGDLLPELVAPRVLRRPDGPLDDTVPAARPITLRHLLTLTFGLGAVMIWPEAWPVQTAMREAGVAPGPRMPDMTSDAYIRAVASVPLIAQPGEMFLYHTGMDVAGILIERAVGAPLAEVMHDRILGPLGMVDTGFYVPAAKLHRLAPVYRPGEDGALIPVTAEEIGSAFDAPPEMASGASELVSTVPDYLRFLRMIRGGGTLDGTRILHPGSVAEMRRDQLTEAQKQAQNALPFMANGGAGWGLGGSVAIRAVEPWLTPGRYGWDGGFGTSAYVDPADDTVAVLMTQRMMVSPAPPETYLDLWRAEARLVGP